MCPGVTPPHAGTFEQCGWVSLLRIRAQLTPALPGPWGKRGNLGGRWSALSQAHWTSSRQPWPEPLSAMASRRPQAASRATACCTHSTSSCLSGVLCGWSTEGTLLCQASSNSEELDLQEQVVKGEINKQTKPHTFPLPEMAISRGLCGQKRVKTIFEVKVLGKKSNEVSAAFPSRGCAQALQCPGESQNQTKLPNKNPTHAGVSLVGTAEQKPNAFH